MTVINDDHIDGSSRLLPPPSTTTTTAEAANDHSSFRSLWSSSSVESIAGIHRQRRFMVRGFRRPFPWRWRRSPLTVIIPVTSTPHREPFRRVVVDSDLDVDDRPAGQTLKIAAICFVVVCVALAIMLVPSLLLSRRMLWHHHHRHKSAVADDLFASFRENPGVVVATW